MLSRTFKILPVIAGGLALGLGQAPALAGLIDPTDPNLAPFTIQVGDFETVSLEQAQVFYGSQYEVQSAPGQLGNYVVVGTGPNGVTGINPTYSGSMDLPYNTPNDQQGVYYFQTGLTKHQANTDCGATAKGCTTFPDPGGDTGGTNHTWDTTISSLDTALNGGKMVIYFNMNETGNTDQLSGIDLTAWARVRLLDSTTGQYRDFFFDGTGAVETAANVGDNGGPDPSAAPADTNPINPTFTDPRWDYVSGTYCIDSGADPNTPDVVGQLGGFLHFGSCSGPNDSGAIKATSVNNNLGAKQAAFGVYSLTLDDILAAGGYDSSTGITYDQMETDFRFSDTDNGYEQVFLASVAGPKTPSIPEPSSLALLGGAFLGFALWRRRRATVIPAP